MDSEQELLPLHTDIKAQMQQVVIAIQNTEAFQLLNVMKVIGDE